MKCKPIALLVAIFCILNAYSQAPQRDLFPTPNASTAIVHGAGHNSGLNHGGGTLRIDAMEYIPIPLGIMSSAKDMYKQIVLSGSPTRTFKKLQDYINYPENKGGLIHQKYIDRFGQKNPVPKLPVFPLPKQ